MVEGIIMPTLGCEEAMDGGCPGGVGGDGGEGGSGGKLGGRGGIGLGGGG